MFRRFRLVSIRGIDVHGDASLVVIAVLIGWTLTTRFAAHGRLAVVLGVAGTVLFFVSILGHELGHALEARHRGMQVHGITLFLFGGVTEMEAHTHRPRDEFVIAAVGPWISLVFGALFGLVATAATELPAAVGRPVGDVAGLLGWLNVALAVFNLIPGAPLDGGRVLRALLWWLLGSRHVAITITSWLGQALGIGVAGFGVWSMTRGATTIGAVWYLVIGLFLLSAARGELRAARLERLYERWRVSDVFGDLEARAAPALVVDPASLPQVPVDADLHDLIAAFQGPADVVAITRDGRTVAVLAEREVAGALARLRRSLAQEPAR
jgi:Zn-dependent protease